MTSQQMSFTEARELLGLAAPAGDAPEGAIPDALTLRKAYVRAIKRYSPESNPQEFQRVRSAYELLEERRRWVEYRDIDDDDVDDSQPHGAPVALPPEERSDRRQTATQGPNPDASALPPWETTQEELTEILADAGCMESGRWPTTPIPPAGLERLLQVMWLGWPESLDVPLIRYTARLFACERDLEGHLVLDRLWALKEEKWLARNMSYRSARLLLKLRRVAQLPNRLSSLAKLEEADVGPSRPPPLVEPVAAPPEDADVDVDDDYGDRLAKWVAVIVGLFALWWLGRWAA